MAPKRNASAAAPAAAPVVTAPAPVTTTQKPKTASPASANDWNTIISNVVDNYQKTPQRTKLIDVFLAFLVVVGIIQFVYCLLITDFPFNSFISGFSVTVAQFVLTASLRIQTTEANKADFSSVSPERAFVDYLVCSFLAHFFAINFIN
ncbi:DAD family protein [Plectosphaerella cucumerina]|uniref:Dolichyl-diphosphooligosaccharide--protein glycosyltransferase subunit OST2 n=1 Tax=Plectosphaerella cucumerina TaxID=40658 RepID=A0A8K0TCH8_9PEZI|nr:DAD family protein [Plectosphaerella cucumerina]